MIGRVIALLLLVAVLAGGGLIWFDYLNVIDAKTVLAPLYRFIGKEGRSQTETTPVEFLNIDAERLKVRLEALDLRKMEMDTQQRQIESRYAEIEQMAQDVEERQKSLDEREFLLKAQADDAEDKDRNVEQLARYLNGMPPERAVGIISATDDQLVIDLLRKTEEIAQAEGTASIVSYWLSLMEPQRAAELQRKMAGKPPSLQ
ncbi:MAG: flagellar protein FlbB [Treponema sp.]|jgi:flagellar protein FlbB|nr:flagellar protein FlbB [Treponema sp.]